MNISVNDLKKIKKLGFDGDTFNSGGNIYQYDDHTLYKIVDRYFFKEEIERNIDFQIKNPIPHTPFIYDKIYINKFFFGYSMENIKNSLTFKKAVYLNVDFDVCMNIVKDVYESIRFLHDRNILLGDIHMDNFLIDDKGRGYVIDLDYIVYPRDEYKFQNLYCVKLNHNSYKINVNNKNTDNIKAMICCLSLILGIDLESKNIHYFEIDLENIYDRYIKDLGIISLNDYFLRIMKGEEVEYFDEFLLNNYSDFLRNEMGSLKRDSSRNR